MNAIDPALKAVFSETLVRTGRKLRTRFNARVVAHGLTYPRARVLAVLSQHELLTQSELACELELEGPTVVRLLDGMEKLGLIERRAVEGDRRAKHVALTVHGSDQARIVEGISVEIRDLILAQTTSRDVTTALAVLQTISDSIDEDVRHAG